MREARYRSQLDPNFTKFLDQQRKGKTPEEVARAKAGPSMVDNDLVANAKKFK